MKKLPNTKSTRFARASSGTLPPRHAMVRGAGSLGACIIGLISLLSLNLAISITPAYAHPQPIPHTHTDAPTGEFTIYPSYMSGNNKSWIILDLEQGSTKTEYVTVENLTEKEQPIKIEFKEAVEEDGSYLPIDNEPYKNIGLWTNIQENIVTLKPYEKRKVPVEITIPDNAEINKYKGTILASKTKKNAQSINITTRIGVRTYININKTNALQSNIFNSPSYGNTFFFLLSLMGVLGSIMYSVIQHLENKKYEKKHA